MPAGPPLEGSSHCTQIPPEALAARTRLPRPIVSSCAARLKRCSPQSASTVGPDRGKSVGGARTAWQARPTIGRARPRPSWSAPPTTSSSTWAPRSFCTSATSPTSPPHSKGLRTSAGAWVGGERGSVRLTGYTDNQGNLYALLMTSKFPLIILVELSAQFKERGFD